MEKPPYGGATVRRARGRGREKGYNERMCATPSLRGTAGVTEKLRTGSMEPTAKNPDPHHIFIDEVQGHQRRWLKVIQFTSSSTKAAAIMLAAAIVALIIANSPAFEPFEEFWHTHVVVGVGGLIGEMSLAHIINDIFMAVFFLLVGLEIKYEMTVGELTNIRQAALPIIAAMGGVLAPIVIYSIFNAANPETSHGWGVPTATDIAFALGIMALLGNRVPNGVRVFLSTLAVADDIIAILVIAIFYGQSPSLMWLAVAAVVLVALVLLNRAHVYSLAPYLLIGCLLWFAVFMSGVHSTIAGVLLAFTIPTGSRVDLQKFMTWSGDRVREARDRFVADEPVVLQKDYMFTVTRLSSVAKQVVPPATRLEHMLYPWVYFAVLPLFALTNADVSFLGGDVLAMVSSPVFFGVFFGLLLGKPIGILLFSFLTVKFKIANLPDHVNWIHMLGAGILGGVEQTKSGRTLAIVDYKGFRVAIPILEMLLYTGEMPSNREYLELMGRLNRMLSTMLGAEIDFMVKGIDSNTRSIVASRKDAMLRKRQSFYMDTDALGEHLIYEGRVVQARVIAVAEKIIRVVSTPI